MQIDESKLFGNGINALAQKAGVDGPNLNKSNRGEIGMSLPVARKVAGAMESLTPVSLYVESQRRAVKNKQAEGSSAAAAYRAIAAVVAELEKVPEDEKLLEGVELQKAIEEMLALLPDTFTGATEQGGGSSEGGKKPKFAEKATEPERPRRDAAGRRVPESSGDHARDGHGRKLR